MATRHEKVVLELDDRFTSGMAKAAAAAALLDKNLDHLSGSSVEATKGVGDTNREVEKTSPVFTQASKDIDRYSGRLGLLAEAAVTLGPALVPIGAVAVPATVALAAGLTAAAGAAGVALLAFHGVGDALKALDEYQLDPSTAHLKKMREEFEKIGPTGVAFVKFLDDLEPELKSLQEVARAGIFPGVEEGITSLLTMFPQLRTIIFSLSTELGNLAASAGSALSGEGFAAFFDYLETDAAPTLEAFAHTLGFVGQGLASLLVDFAPLSRDFSSGMESMAKSFANWSANLAQTEGFRDFVAYVRESGPQVLHLLGAMATAFIDIARAAAPVGAAVIPTLTAMARVLSLIAESPIGPPLFTAVAAMLALNRATVLASAGLAKFKVTAEGASASASKFGAGVSFAAILSGIGLVNAAFNKLDERVDANNLGRNIEAFAGGASVDNLDNLGKSLDIASSHMARFNDVFGAIATLNIDDSSWEKAKEDIANVDQALAGLVESGRAKEAAAAFARIAEQAEAQGVSLEDTKAAFSAYQTALDNAGPSADQAAQAARKVAQAHNQQAASADKAAASTEGLVGAMEDEVDAALKAFDAETQYRQALKDAQAQAKKNEAGIRGNSDAVLKNRGALSQLAAAWNSQSDAVKNNVGRYKEARQSFLDVADSMNVPIAKAKALADRLFDIPKSIVIKQQNNMDPAVRTAKLLAAAIRNIPTSWLTNYTINTIRTGTKPELHAPAANGATVPKTGQGYADRHPYLLADGEEVISNRHGQADRHRGLLKAINAGYLAGGGTAGRDGHNDDKRKPLFTSEGPRWYGAAYRHNRPFALDGPSHWAWPYQTVLTPALARAFEKWVIANNVPFDASARITDYDMRGYWKQTRGRGWHEGSHFPDTFKTPYDTTFSHESKYATADNPFYWHGDKLIDTRNGRVVFAAGGATVPKTGMGYADRHPYMLADGEEVISNRFGQADRHRGLLKAINAGHLADGGTAGVHQSLDDRLAIAQAMQQLRELRRSLAKDGKDRLEGLNRRIAELQIQAAQKEIRLAEHRAEQDARQEERDKLKDLRDKAHDKRETLQGIASGLSFDSLLPQDPQTVAQGVHSEIADFKRQILDAGGVWTKAMRKWAADMAQTAKEYDHTQKALNAETKKRDDLVDTLNDQKAQLDQLNSTMASYSASVASNFLTNPFNGARTDTVQGVKDGPASQALKSAQDQLAALRASSMGDSVALAAQAAELIARIKDLQKSADAEVDGTEVQVSGLQALRETLLSDTAKSDRMAAALKELADKGLDTTGALGGLYQQLAASGDVSTAEQLANLSADQIDEYEKLFKAREDSAALVAAQATQAVYGQQQQQLNDLIAQTTAAIAQADANIVALNAELILLGAQVKQGATDGVVLLQPQLNALTFGIGLINQSVQALPKQIAEQKRKNKL